MMSEGDSVPFAMANASQDVIEPRASSRLPVNVRPGLPRCCALSWVKRRTKTNQDSLCS